MQLLSNFITDDKKAVMLSSKFPTMTIISSMDFFLECDAYDIIIPINSSNTNRSEFSIVERCVLKLLSIDSSLTDEEISDKLCLGTCNSSTEGFIDTSFTRIIRARLKDNGLIEDSGKITEKGEQVIKLISKTQKETSDEILIQVFCIRQLNNKLLSFIHIGSIESETFDRDRRNIILKYGTAGDERKIEGKLISFQHDRKKSDYIPYKAPSPDDVKRAIKKYNKLCETDNDKINYDSRYGISVSGVPGSVIIHIKAMLQNGNVLEPIVSDGFSCNIDGVLDLLNKNDKNQKEDALKLLFERGAFSKDGMAVTEEMIKEKEYPEIYRHMKDLTIHKGDSIDSNLAADKANSKIIKKCFSALEWTLHYYLIKKPDIKTAIKLMAGSSSYVNQMSAIEYSKKLGLKMAETTVLFSGTDGISIERWQNGNSKGDVTPVMKELLPIALCYAVISDDICFKTLAIRYPKFLVSMERLNYYAADIRHNGFIDTTADEVQKIVKFTKDIISLLIPDIYINGCEESQTNIESSSKYILNNTVNLSEMVGWDMWNSLSDGVRKILLDLAPANDKDANLRLSSCELVLGISQALEALIYEEIQELKKEIQEFKVEIQKRTADRKISRSDIVESIERRLGRDVSEGYNHVGEHYLNYALRMGKTTLNAMTLVYLGAVENSKLEELSKIGFDEFIIDITELRGHGNDVNLVLDDEKRKELRNKLFNIIKVIGG